LKIAVLGGGNGSFAAAGDFALQSHEVRLWRRDSDLVEAHRSAGSRILLEDANGRHEVKLALVTTNIADAVRDTDLILCPAPAFAQMDIARTLAPHLHDGQVVFCRPAPSAQSFLQWRRTTSEIVPTSALRRRAPCHG
jgi:opine dehydrogenase